MATRRLDSLDIYHVAKIITMKLHAHDPIGCVL